jgi:hypothetical protein
MPESLPDRAAAGPRDDGTRDIRLPPLPGRPTPTAPPEWASYVPTAAPIPGGAPPPTFDEPTERLPSDPTPGRTQAFPPRPDVGPFRVSVTARRSRTGRPLWTLFFLIVAVLVASGVALVLFVTQR